MRKYSPITSKCDRNWKTCGHCKVASYAPGEDYPCCDKSGFLRAILGHDMCPNAPWPYEPDEEKKGEAE